MASLIPVKPSAHTPKTEGSPATQNEETTETQTEPIIVNMDKFSVYDDIRAKLIARGIPAEEIAFIHNANTEVSQKSSSCFPFRA